MSVVAIQTYYSGYYFRSRGEARWCCWLNHLGVPFDYEKEGYVIDGIAYLPDFWIPSALRNSWLEIKPEDYVLCDEDMKAFAGLARKTKAALYLIAGLPGARRQRVSIFAPTNLASNEPIATCVIAADLHMAWTGDTNSFTVAADNGIRLWSEKTHKWFDFIDIPQRQEGSGERLEAAFRFATTARFEHGEKPQVPMPSVREDAPQATSSIDLAKKIAEKRSQLGMK